MTEKEKMLAGAPYDAQDPQLAKDRRRARRLVRRYNNADPDDDANRRRILAELLGSGGATAYIEPPFRCDYGANLHVGDRFYANFGLVVLDCAPVTIGRNVMLGPSVQIYTATHPLDAEERRRGLESAKPIVIEDDVWIGGAAVLNPGIRIGRGSTIGAGSVVTRDVPAGVFAAGNPCRVIKPCGPPSS